jgi:hypothetical protein
LKAVLIKSFDFFLYSIESIMIWRVGSSSHVELYKCGVISLQAQYNMLNNARKWEVIMRFYFSLSILWVLGDGIEMWGEKLKLMIMEVLLSLTHCIST